MTSYTPSRRSWSVLSGLFLVYMASNGITLHTLPLLYPQLMETFGWQEGEVTLPATVFFIVGALTSPPAGWLLDRYSARAIIAIGSALLGLALVAYSATATLWQLVAIYALLGLALSLCGLVSNMVMLTGWFQTGRGRATGILLMASSLGGALFPLAVGTGIEHLGWRQTVLATGLCVGCVMLGSAWLLLRDGPRSAIASATDDAPRAPLSDILSIMMARRFFAIVFATGSLWFIIIALTQHQSIYLVRDVGLDRSLLPSIFSLFFGASVMGKLGFGWLADRFDLHRVMAAATIVLAGALGLLSQASSLGQPSSADMGLLYTYAILAGLGFSGAFTCIQILVAAHYSGPHYGKILATIVLIDTLCGALGTRVVAIAREWQESYVPALTGLALLAVFSALLVMTLSLAGPTESKMIESA